MQNLKFLVIVVALLALGVVQIYSLRNSNARLAALEARIGELSVTPAVAGTVEVSGTPGVNLEHGQRLARLEALLSQPGRATNPASPRGQPVLTASARTELLRKLSDPSVSEKDKLQALRALRRVKPFDDDALQGALGWLQTSPDPVMRREILQQLDGITNAALRQPLLELAASTDAKLRQQAVNNLRDFISDAAVEKQLWEIMQKDPDGKVREEAQEALRKGPMTPERAASLQQRAVNAEAPMDERLTALRALQKGKVDVADAANAIAQAAQHTTDVVMRANIFSALDGVHDPRLLPPLLAGVQDPSPDVRKEATEALSGFASNPNIRQWLEYIAQTDTDSQVKREAFQALKKLQEGPR